MDVYEEIIRLKIDGRSVVPATVVQCIGSSPQRAASKMLVSAGTYRTLLDVHPETSHRILVPV